ncbi:hypothetical protein FDECE_15504 [Fusarium decemcellulare]|nr:hypothetical protein FDECE_15504 [Fusarium decemcellulare]
MAKRRRGRTRKRTRARKVSPTLANTDTSRPAPTPVNAAEPVSQAQSQVTAREIAAESLRKERAHLHLDHLQKCVEEITQQPIVAHKFDPNEFKQHQTILNFHSNTLRQLLSTAFDAEISTLAPCSTDSESHARLKKSITDIANAVHVWEHEDDINQALGSNQTVRPWMIDQHDRTERVEALRDLAEIRLIVRESRSCLRMGASEAAWNDGVTSRVLFLALGRVEGVRHHNITTARPQQCLVPKDLSGDQFDGKLVDYSINLITENEDDEDEMGQGDAEMENAIRNLLSHVPTKRKTINQTCYGPVRFDPCGINIETKATGTSDGRVQLSMWIAAWMEQMRYLRAVAANPSHRRWEELEDFRQPIQLQMPSIVAFENIWTLYLATDTPSKIVFIAADTSLLDGWPV